MTVVQVMAPHAWVDQIAQLLADNGVDVPVVRSNRSVYRASRTPHPRKAEQ